MRDNFSQRLKDFQNKQKCARLQIKNKEDWESASQIAELLYSQSNYYQKHSRFLKISCHTLLTAAILLCYQTIYPDLLSVRNFLLLPRLKERLSYADKELKLIKFGTEVTNALQQFTCCPNSDITLDLILIETIKIIEFYLARRNLNFLRADFILRADYFQRLFPLPKTDDRREIITIFKKAKQLIIRQWQVSQPISEAS